MKTKNETPTTEVPSILRWEGQQPWQKPHIEQKVYNGRVVRYFRGYVSIEAIQGWVANPRIDLFVKRYKAKNEGELPTNDEILNWMIQQGHEFELEGLADNIALNGVHEPIIVTADGTLLDGNRRYFACLWKYRQSQKAGNDKVAELVKYAPAYVLLPGATSEEREAILIFRNYGQGLHKRWPTYIRANKICEDLEEMLSNGVTKKTARQKVADKYNEKESEVARYEKMLNAIEQFREFHLTDDEEEGRTAKDSLDVEQVCHDKFEYFDELAKPRVWSCLNNDAEIRAKTFERLYNGEFANWNQIRKLPEIATEPKARAIFCNGGQPDRNPVEEAIDTVGLFRLVKKAVGANERVQSFAKWLKSLTAEDYDDLDQQSVSDLRDIAELAAKIAEALHDKAGAEA